MVCGELQLLPLVEPFEAKPMFAVKARLYNLIPADSRWGWNPDRVRTVWDEIEDLDLLVYVVGKKSEKDSEATEETFEVEIFVECEEEGKVYILRNTCCALFELKGYPISLTGDFQKQIRSFG